jgi:superfamily II DNA/RNA helicase
MFIKKLDQQLSDSLAENGLTAANELQQICIPRIKSGLDLICLAPNRSGKSTTIVVSILQRLKSESGDNARALIMVPNTERAIQMKNELERLGAYTNLRVHTACDDEKIDDQKDQIYMGSDVVIGTPRRLNQIFSLYALNLSNVQLFAIDDADLVIKNLSYLLIDRLSESLPKTQKVIFTGKMNEWIERYADKYMASQEVIEIEEETENE